MKKAVVKNMEYLWINLKIVVKNLYTENYKIVLKKFKELNKWKDMLCVNFLQFIHVFNTFSIKISL